MIDIVLGASPNPRRYSYRATEVLVSEGKEVIPVGVKQGEISGLQIQNKYPENVKIDTIAMYLSLENQEKYYELILSNLPRRVIFNPGTFNHDFQKTLTDKGVTVVNDCVLVMVSRNIY